MVVAAVFAATVALAVGITVGLAVSLILLVGAVAAVLIVIGLLVVAAAGLLLIVAGPVLAAMSVVSFALSRLVADGVRPSPGRGRRPLPDWPAVRSERARIVVRRLAEARRWHLTRRGGATKTARTAEDPAAEDVRPLRRTDTGPARFGLPR